MTWVKALDTNDRAVLFDIDLFMLRDYGSYVRCYYQNINLLIRADFQTLQKIKAEGKGETTKL